MSMLSLFCAVAMAVPADTLRVIDLEEAVAVATPKETGALRDLPAAVSTVGQLQMASHRIASLKGVAAIVPNLFVPDYGSRLTTAVYIRGIGSRMNTPAVGLYVDNVPFIDKSAFDFSLYDVERIDVLRGPQSTLYGRNAMGGLVRVFTKSPFRYEGTDVHLGAGMYDNCLHATHHHRLNDRLALSCGVAVQGKRGCFENGARNGERVDKGGDVAARLRALYSPSERVTLDFQVNYEYTDEGGYPYFFAGWESEAAQQKDYFRTSLEGLEGKLAYNRRSSYKRHLLNAGINAEHRWNKLVLTNIVGGQWLKDDMLMDQDFTPVDIYTLRQLQRSTTVSDEIAVKTLPRAFDRWEMTSGASGFWQGLSTEAPVTFRADGIDWLNGLMNAGANRFLPTVQAGPMTMNFIFSDLMLGPDLAMAGTYKTPSAGAAVYHQSRIRDVFTEGLSLTFGARLDYEHQRLRYDSHYAFQHEYALNGHLSMPQGEKDIAMVPAATYDAERRIGGRFTHGYLQFLPKASVAWEFGKTDDYSSGNVYATFSRGFRSGGYNIQMFSEVMQSMLTADIMTAVRDVTVPVLEQQPAVPADTKAQVTAILDKMAQSPAYDADALTKYRPEFAWNYEVGTHLNLLHRTLLVDVAAFFNDVRHQQLSRMSETGLGRITVNAGRSRSAGLEASLTYRPVENVLLRGNYGYTHATFHRYATVDANGQAADYAGNYVPFVPQHTVSASAERVWPLSKNGAKIIDLVTGIDYSGTGRIYWTEDNRVSQSFYSLLGARVGVDVMKRFSCTLWATNITATRYNAFYFETMHRAFEQHGRPFQLGVDVKFHF